MTQPPPSPNAPISQPTNLPLSQPTNLPISQPTTLPIPQPTNPYVGPRTFTAADRSRFFGREAEAAGLLARVVSERLLLFYAQSGAGKSSLINARLIPQLREEEGFGVLPVGRVAGQLPPGAAPVDNIYLFNLMASLDQGGGDPARWAGLGLSEFLDHLVTDDGLAWRYDPAAADAPESAADEAISPGGANSAPRFALIIDQFEEIITGHPDRWREREGFFRQLDAALQDNPNLWVVLSLREDYLAALDPYAALMFNRLRARFYMERMGVAAALDAIRQPAALAGRPFAPGVAEKLADELRQVRVPGQEATVPGQYIEPVQLQVVCYQLWENLAAPSPLSLQGRGAGGEGEISLGGRGAGGEGEFSLGGRGAGGEGEITFDDLARAGDVNQALTQFYEETLALALADPAAAGVSERQLRAWFDAELITPAGTRGLVHQGEAATGGLPNGVVRALQRRFLVRSEARGGDTWIELVHDRFVEPIRASNAAWFPLHLSALQRQAALWDEQGRPEGLLWTGKALAQAETWAAEQAEPLEAVEQEFLAACRRAEAIAVRERRQSRRIRWLAAGLAVIAVLAVAASIAALRSRERAWARELAAAAIANLPVDPERSTLLALESLDIERSAMAGDALHRALAASRVEAVLRGHESEVSDTAYSPDGARLASAGFDGSLRLWDAHSHGLLHTWPTGHGQVYSVAWSPDGARLASTGQDGVVRLWDAASGQELATLEAHELAGNSVAWSADGRLLASGGDDGRLLAWDAVTLDLLLDQPLLDQPMIKAVAISPDGGRLAAALAFPQAMQTPGRAVVLDVFTGDELMALEGHSDSVLDVAWSPPCGEGLAAANDCVALIATASADGTARTWDAATGALRDVLAGHEGWVQGVAFSPDGRRLATSSWDRTAKVWEASSGRELFTLARHAGWLRGLDWNPACQPAPDPSAAALCGQQLATAGEDGAIRLWNTGPSRELFSFVASSQPVLGLAWSPNGLRLATAHRDGRAVVWEAASGRPELTVRHLGPVRAVAWSPDGRLLATASDDRSAVIWDAASGELRQTLAGTRGAVTGVAWAPDGQRLATSGSDSVARVWDAASGRELLALEGHTGRVNNVAWSPDGRRLATSGGDRTARLWDAASGALLLTLAGHEAEVYFVTWSPDGKTVATASVDQTARLWDAASGQALRALPGHANRVQAVALSGAGQAATGSWDRSARLWDADSGELLATLAGHDGPVLAVAFSPDARRLATTGDDGTVRLYLTQLEELSLLARQRLTRTWTSEECQVYLQEATCPRAP